MLNENPAIPNAWSTKSERRESEILIGRREKNFLREEMDVTLKNKKYLWPNISLLQTSFSTVAHIYTNIYMHLFP